MNAEPEAIVNAEDEKPDDALRSEIEKSPLAPVDPRLRKPGDGPLQANQDPLNGVNE